MNTITGIDISDTSKLVHNDIISKCVLTEKSPFYVSIRNHNTGEYDGEYLVRPCASEDDLKEARLEYERNKSVNQHINIVELLSYNPSKYYLGLDEMGSYFLGRIISKGICKRIRK